MNIKDSIEFNGVTYKLLSNGRYYLSQSTTNEGRRHAKSLHVAIWEYHNKQEVPKDCCIHHIDGDVFNNDISNLECVKRKDHLSHHSKKNWENEEYRERQTEVLRNASDSASEWHRSDEGREWHKKHGKENMEKRVPIKLTCEFCNKEFESIQPWAKYCSSSCYEKWRNRNNRVEVTGTCIVCGQEFTSTKSKKQKETTRFCGRSCRNKFAYSQRVKK